MLTEDQTARVWNKMAEAEVRSLYFGDLAARYTKRKQMIVAASFFLSSGAAASLWATMPAWVPLTMAIIVALLTGYSIAVNLDKAALTMANLHGEWNRLSNDYEHLWNRWYADDAEDTLKALLERAGQVSVKGSTEAPYDQNLIDKWETYVYSQYQATAA